MMLIGTKGWNFYEHLFTTITLFLTVGVFAYTINAIGTIIDNINRESLNFKNQMSLINKYMKKNKTSASLQ